MPTPPKITSLADRLANGTAPPIPVNDSIALLTAPQEVTVVTTLNRAESGDPEALLLALHVAAGRAGDRVGVQAGSVLGGAAVRLSDVGDHHRAEEHQHHRRVDRVPLTAVARHPPVGEHQRSGDDQHRQHLDEVREAGGVLERVGGIRVEEAATVGAQQLDRLLRADWPHRDRLVAQVRQRRERRDSARGSGARPGKSAPARSAARAAATPTARCARCPARSCPGSCRCATRSRGSGPPRRRSRHRRTGSSER